MATQNQITASDSAAAPAGTQTEPGQPGKQKALFPRSAPVWTRVFPFFTSALFFLSGIFAVFAPIPLLILNLRSGRLLGLLAVLTNGALIYYAGGTVSLCAYVVFVTVLSVTLAELLRAKVSVEAAAVTTLFSMFLVGGALLGWFAHVHHVNAWNEVRSQVSAAVDLLGKNAPQGALSTPADVEDWKQGVLLEFPSALAVFALVMVWVNLVAVLRINPQGIREKLGLDLTFFKKWRSPQWLVWPTIATGLFLVIDAGRISEVSLNIFKFLMAIYTIQGLSILSFFFDLWNVRGFFRAAGYLVSIFVMMPLLLSLGFFDLWFDFRAKFSQQR